MAPDPRHKTGPFWALFDDVRRCKEACTCPDLFIRGYYFEPNPRTIGDWQREGRYLGEIDRRVMFVCESPGPSGKNGESGVPERCWVQTPRDRRFDEVRRRYGFENSYVTNTVKCGPRKGSRHSGLEFEACTRFLVREIELIRPMIAVGVGQNALQTLRAWVLPQCSFTPVLFQITHYSVRRNPWASWEREFPELRQLLSRLKPQREWVS